MCAPRRERHAPKRSAVLRRLFCEQTGADVPGQAVPETTLTGVLLAGLLSEEGLAIGRALVGDASIAGIRNAYSPTSPIDLVLQLDYEDRPPAALGIELKTYGTPSNALWSSETNLTSAGQQLQLACDGLWQCDAASATRPHTWWRARCDADGYPVRGFILLAPDKVSLSGELTNYDCADAFRGAHLLTDKAAPWDSVSFGQLAGRLAPLIVSGSKLAQLIRNLMVP